MAGIVVKERLPAFLDRTARKPFQWGQSDCMLEVADWLDFCCRLGAADAWRGRYSSAEEAAALMPEGLGTAMRSEARRLGLEEAAEPRPGDVALVTIPGQDKPLGAILLLSGRWRMKTVAGVLMMRDVTVLVAWSLPCRLSSPPPS